jgi:signal transduction histidine kinase
VNIKVPNWLNQFLDVPMAAPDVRRRARLLNILLVGTAVIIIIAVLITGSGQLAGRLTSQAAWGTYATAVPFIIIMAAIYAVNRFWSGRVAATLFLLIFIAILYLSDTPYESIWGRNMVTLTIPIFMASVLLPPVVSFHTAGMIIVVSLGITYFESFEPNYLGSMTYLAVAFVSWLASRSMDRAVIDLRQINRELDQRVVERTAELQETNIQLESEIEARKKASAELVIARDKALEASRLKSQLLANISHELRTPLGAILGFAEMLRGEFYGPVNEQQRTTISKIIETNQDLTGLVAELLDQAQLEAGRLKLNYRVFEPGELLLDSATRLSILAEEKGLEFIREVDPDLPVTLIGDPARLQQVLTNLLGNAIKFTEEGRVTASVYRVDAHEWALAVQDTGPGIPEEAREYIFEPFRQVDGTITREHEGSGLGLSIVNQLVGLMNGRIELQSEMGQGSLVTVALPILMPNEENPE